MTKFTKYADMFLAIAAPLLCLGSLISGDWLMAACMALIGISAILDWNRYD